MLSSNILTNAKVMKFENLVKSCNVSNNQLKNQRYKDKL